MTINDRFKRTRSIILYAFLIPLPALSASAPPTLNDLKKLEIICFVPSYLPDGFQLKSVEITYDEIQEYEDKNRPLPLYSLEYGDMRKATFTIESAREGIGDRNIMATEDADETEIQSPFGPMFLIYTPKGEKRPQDRDQGELGQRREHESGESEGPDGASGLGKIPRVFRDWNYGG